MARCYLLAVCRGTSIDETHHNVTIYSLVEEVQVAARAGQDDAMPFEMLACIEYDSAETERPIEFRFVVEGPNETIASPTIVFVTEKARMRIRSAGVPFRGAGRFKLRAEWRASGADRWHRDPSAWPFEVSVLPE